MMLAYCEVCRVVQFEPRPTTPRSDDPIRGFRIPADGEFFAHCRICKRVQIFVVITMDIGRKSD